MLDRVLQIEEKIARIEAFLLVVFVLLVLFATVGPFIGQWDHDQPDFLALKQPPSAEHWFGTDVVGADMFALSVRGLGPGVPAAHHDHVPGARIMHNEAE